MTNNWSNLWRNPPSELALTVIVAVLVVAAVAMGVQSVPH